MGFTNAFLGIGLFLGQSQSEEISKENIALGRTFYETGVRHLSKKRYSQAINAFEQSYHLTRAPALLYNIGLAQRGAGDEEAAMGNFSKFFPHADAEQKKQIGDTIVEICNRAGEYDFCMSLIDERYAIDPTRERARQMAAVCDRYPNKTACTARYRLVWDITQETTYLLSLSERLENMMDWGGAISTLQKYIELKPNVANKDTLVSKLNTLKKAKQFHERQTRKVNSIPPEKPRAPRVDKTTLILASTATAGFAAMLISTYVTGLNCSSSICSEKSQTAYNVSLASAIVTDVATGWLVLELWQKSRLRNAALNVDDGEW